MQKDGYPKRQKRNGEYPKKSKEKWRTSLFDHVEAGVCDVVVFKVILLRGEISDEDWVVLRRDERGSVQPHWSRHGKVQIT